MFLEFSFHHPEVYLLRCFIQGFFPRFPQVSRCPRDARDRGDPREREGRGSLDLSGSGFFSSLVSPHLGATLKGIEAKDATDPSSKNFDFFINLSSPFKAINSLKMLYKSINKYQKWWVYIKNKSKHNICLPFLVYLNSFILFCTTLCTWATWICCSWSFWAWWTWATWICCSWSFWTWWTWATWICCSWSFWAWWIKSKWN